MKFGTKAIHSGIEPDPTTGAIMTPIYQTSTYVQTRPGGHQGYEYSRTHNPTRDALQKSLTGLENGSRGLVFSSGMAAIDTLLKMLKPGDEVISVNDLYGGTYRIFTTVFSHYGIKFKFVDLTDVNKLDAELTDNTKLIWVETPTNPTLQIVDIKGVVEKAKKVGALVAVDNTFATPYFQTPLDLGADIAMHSMTKYLSGHSDVVMGCLVVKDEELADQLAALQNSCGAVPGPQDCFLALRGIKTLHLRMQRHGENGEEVARFLKVHPRVDKVYWPGFKDHKNHEIAAAQMSGFGGMLSFNLKSGKREDAITVLESTKVFACAESLGGVESLSGHPASMTHASIPKEEREKNGITESLIRLSVGVEDIEDLIADLGGALAKI